MTDARELGSGLSSFTNPRRVAVVGGSRDETKMGGRLLRNMRHWSGSTPVEIVHPTAEEIAGFPCVPSVSDLDAPDLAIVAVRQERVAEQVALLGETDVRAVVVIASGYADLGTQQGADLQAELLSLCEGLGVQMLGPNTNGFLSVVNRLCATSNPGSMFDLSAGRIGVVGQSGALSLGTVLAQGARYGLGFSQVFSTGNEAMVTGWDVATGLQEDPDTDVIGLIVEGWRGFGRYLDYLAVASNPKPVVALKIGRTDAGGQAAMSHTAQIQTGETVDRGFLRQAGIHPVETLREFYEVMAGATSVLPAARSRKGLAIVSTSGGASGLAADLAVEKNLPLAEFDVETEEGLRGILPDFGTVQNPLDVTSVGVGDPGLYGAALRELARSKTVDGILAIVTVSEDFSRVRDELLEVARHREFGLVVGIMGGSVAPVDWELLRSEGVPVIEDLDEALNHLAGWYLTLAEVDTNE